MNRSQFFGTCIGLAAGVMFRNKEYLGTIGYESQLLELPNTIYLKEDKLDLRGSVFVPMKTHFS